MVPLPPGPASLPPGPPVPPIPSLQPASDTVIDCPAASWRYEIFCPAYASAPGVHRPVTGTVAALSTRTVSLPPGSSVATTPDALSAMRAFTIPASSSIVGLTTGNVARSLYLASTASIRVVNRL